MLNESVSSSEIVSISLSINLFFFMINKAQYEGVRDSLIVHIHLQTKRYNRLLIFIVQMSPKVEISLGHTESMS